MAETVRSQKKEAIVLVHLGPDLPSYLNDCLHQIRLWNDPSQVDIYLILFKEVLANVETVRLALTHSVRLIATEFLTPTSMHSAFITHFKEYDATFRNHYWRHVIERFYYIEELMDKYALDSVIHMENDVLLYEDMAQVGPLLRQHIPTMALPFDNDTQGYASFMVINNREALTCFNTFISANCNVKNMSDMKLLSLFNYIYPQYLVSLPQIPRSVYEAKPHRQSWMGMKPTNTQDLSFLCNRFDELGGRLFDAVAIGQYICGVDPRNLNGMCLRKFINESSFYNVLEFGIQWKRDAKGRWYMASTTPEEHKIVNLHVHSKMLCYFLSDRVDEPKDDYTDTPTQEFYMNMALLE